MLKMLGLKRRLVGQIEELLALACMWDLGFKVAPFFYGMQVHNFNFDPRRVFS